MKKILILLLLFSALSANAQTYTAERQTDSGKVHMIVRPDSTGIGAPDGQLVSKEIGSAGGKIVSDDGRVELIFPEGALSTNTSISIQPTTNLAPNGVGKSYLFEPSGIQFKKPVQINFRYTDEEADICPPDWMSLGIQDHKGKWSFIDYEIFDSVSKTLNGYIQHFSGASNINDVQLRPDKNKLPVGGRTLIDVSDVSTFDSTLPSGHGLALLPGSNIILWYANGILHGNEYTGKIAGQSAPFGKEIIKAGDYTAPQLLPKTNPVKISAEIYRKTRKGKVLRKRLSAYILVYVEYKVTVSQDINLDNDVRLTDSSSFNLKIDDRVSISDIQNQLAKLIIGQSSCRPIYVNASTCVGMINVTGIRASKIFPGSAGGFPSVEILFMPAPLAFPIVNFPPCGPNLASPTTLPAFSPYAFPMWFSFQLKNETQTIILGEDGASSRTGRPDPEDIIVTIVPIRD